METQRQYEAATLAEVLVKVQKELGPEASISSAQRVRRGGFLGFFQHERVQVIATLPDDASYAAATEASETLKTRAAKSAPMKKVAKKVAATSVVTKKSAATTSATAAKTATATTVAKADTPRSATTLLELAEEINELSFDDVLARSVDEQSSAYLQSASDNNEDDDEDEGRSLVLPVTSRASATPSPTHEVAEHERIAEQSARPVDPYEPIAEALRSLGLPDVYRPAFTNDLQRDIMHALDERLPAVPKLSPSRGAVICVVGARRQARHTAERIAQQFDSTNICSVFHTAHNDNISSPTDAENARRSWSRRRDVTVVYIEAAIGSLHTKWAEQMLAAFEPIATFAVLEGNRKPDDALAWAKQLGGVDAFVVTHIDETVSPASILHTGIPVESIDGKLATAAAWSLLLTDRIAKFASGEA